MNLTAFVYSLVAHVALIAYKSKGTILPISTGERRYVWEHAHTSTHSQLLKEQNKLYFKTLFLQSQSRSVGRKKCKSNPCIFGNFSKHLKVWENEDLKQLNQRQYPATCILKQEWCPFLSNIPFFSPNSYNMIQYATAHLKVLESEGKERHKPSHLHFLLYNAFFGAW